MFASGRYALKSPESTVSPGGLSLNWVFAIRLPAFTGFPSCVTAYGLTSVIPTSPANPAPPAVGSSAARIQTLVEAVRKMLGNPQWDPPERTRVAPIARLSTTLGGTVFTIE